MNKISFGLMPMKVAKDTYLNPLTIESVSPNKEGKTIITMNRNDSCEESTTSEENNEYNPKSYVVEKTPNLVASKWKAALNEKDHRFNSIDLTV